MTQVNPIQVKCPRCDALLSVPAEHRGDAFACQQCGNQIKVPGSVGQAAADDDDWLRLESDLEPPPRRRSQEPELSELDEFDLPDLENIPQSQALSRPQAEPDPFDLPDLKDMPESQALSRPQAESEPFDLPDLKDIPESPLGGPRSAQPPPLSEADLDALGGFVDDPSQRPAPMKLVPPKEPVDDSFRVRCSICDSMTYARPAQVGKRIRCHDCHSPILVPPPPKVRPKYQPDIEAATAYTFRDADIDGETPRPADPFRKSADDYLRAAEAADSEAEDDEWELPDLRQWLFALVSMFRDPAVTIHAALLTLLAFVPAAIALQFESSVIVLGLFIGGTLFGVIVVSCGFAILQSVANGEDRVSEWPIFDPAEAMGEIVVAIAAITFAAGPAWMLGFYVFQGGLVTVALSMISLYVLFPVVILSMLDEQSILSPFSADVTKSVTRAADQWGAAYLCSGLLFFVMFLLYMVSTVIPPLLGALLAIATTVCGVFVYFGIVGRLAYGIGHAINAPPMTNEIDRTREPPKRRDQAP